jgi:hypothetical protein
MIRGFDRLWALPGLGALSLCVACTSTSFSGSSSRAPVKPKVEDESEDALASEDETKDEPAEAPGGGTPEAPTGADVDAPLPPSNDPSFFDEPPQGMESIREVFVGEVATVNRVVDIIFAMDTSGSMDQEKANLEANMSTFIQTFETGAKAVDYKVFMIGAGFKFPTGSEDIITVNQKVESNDALAILQRFFEGTIPSPSPLRDEAIKQIVVITDDDAIGVTSTMFKDYIQANPSLKDKTSVNGFVGLPTSAQGQGTGCALAAIGNEYITLGTDPEVGGLIQDLCVQDWGDLLKDLANKIIKQTSKGSFPLEAPADSSQEVVVSVDGAVLSAEQVTYDPDQNVILFTPGNEPPEGAEIVVIYVPKSQPAGELAP